MQSSRFSSKTFGITVQLESKFLSKWWHYNQNQFHGIIFSCVKIKIWCRTILSYLLFMSSEQNKDVSLWLDTLYKIFKKSFEYNVRNYSPKVLPEACFFSFISQLIRVCSYCFMFLALDSYRPRYSARKDPLGPL